MVSSLQIMFGCYVHLILILQVVRTSQIKNQPLHSKAAIDPFMGSYPALQRHIKSCVVFHSPLLRHTPTNLTLLTEFTSVHIPSCSFRSKSFAGATVLGNLTKVLPIIGQYLKLMTTLVNVIQAPWSKNARYIPRAVVTTEPRKISAFVLPCAGKLSGVMMASLLNPPLVGSGTGCSVFVL